MWAAHDDNWSPNYVRVLAKCLDNAPDASLATGYTEVESVDETGKVSLSSTWMAPNANRWKTLDVLIEEFACVWIYGMFRTEWLKNAAPELLRYPFHYGDFIWLFGMMLTQRVVGDQSAIFFYHQTRGKYKERTYRRKMELWASVAKHVIQLSWSRLPLHERPLGLWKACWLVYKHHIRRGNPVGTSVRIIKLAALWTWFGLQALRTRVLSGFLTAPQVSEPTEPKKIENSIATSANQDQRRAA
jgi:hypothetical protein